MKVPVDVIGQSITCHCNMKFVAGSSKFVKFVFKLDDDWKSLTNVAKFKQGTHTYNQTLDEDYTTFLPSDLTPGMCEMTLYGSGSDGTIATTEVVTIELVANNII